MIKFQVGITCLISFLKIYVFSGILKLYFTVIDIEISMLYSVQEFVYSSNKN